MIPSDDVCCRCTVGVFAVSFLKYIPRSDCGLGSPQLVNSAKYAPLIKGANNLSGESLCGAIPDAKFFDHQLDASTIPDIYCPVIPAPTEGKTKTSFAMVSVLAGIGLTAQGRPCWSLMIVVEYKTDQLGHGIVLHTRVVPKIVFIDSGLGQALLGFYQPDTESKNSPVGSQTVPKFGRGMMDVAA